MGSRRVRARDPAERRIATRNRPREDDPAGLPIKLLPSAPSGELSSFWNRRAGRRVDLRRRRLRDSARAVVRPAAELVGITQHVVLVTAVQDDLRPAGR